MLDFISIGDSSIDAFHLLEDNEIELSCALDTKECRISLSYADKIPVKDFKLIFGGNAANAAIGAARLGFQSGIITTVGDDPEGTAIRTEFAKEDVQTDYILTDHDHQTNYSTILSYKGERTILIYHAPRRYRLPKFSKPKWLYLTSMAKGSEVIFPELTDVIRRDGLKIVFQPGTFQLRLGLKPARELLSHTEIIIMNKEEAELYLSMPNSPVEALVQGLLAIGPKIAVVTDARNGATAGHGQRRWHIRTRPEIPRVESTGAGDAFSTALTGAIMYGHDIPTALRWGTLNAESVIQQIGPQAGLLTREAIEQQLASAQELQAEIIR